MKELSIEEKAKRYDEAIKKVNDYYEGKTKLYSNVDKTLDCLFPELKKESEDEKVKRILHSISSKMSFHLPDIFTEEEFQCFDTWSNAWLEKQGEQKPVDFKAKDWYVSKVDGKIHNMTYNPTDKVEPNPTWSEADERNLKSIMKIIKEKAFADYDVDEDNNMLGIYGILESWLKSLKDRVQPQWKPSEEQIKDFGGALLILKLQHYASSESLQSLYEQLKKL